ncbi:hydrophobin [Serpula lacrymans var. lacrymans S7.9]|uniref:Hydrophobin n=1 Tax=Serpula lacrymans var. lacrymans (strain S7.9) TaxID=578457 RepID=F8NGA0_SERL9|nr:hydrophobin [Serpula lacrymans var. lacrymans S7.9]EGO30078.1 hydrophobin [Serpula lacrymans var. lacrymans S7.9]
MIARISALFMFALLAVASPARRDNTVNQCNTKSIRCCDSMTDSKSSDFDPKPFATLLKLDVSQITGQIGFKCSPITAVGVGGGSSCKSEPVCCTNNQYDGIINIGCSPVNVNL